MPYLTIFSAPKSFSNPHINVIQMNAIQSWCHLGAEVEVFLVGDEPGMQQVADDYQLPVLKDIRRNDSGTPLVSSIFQLARIASESPYLAYVNGDILLLPDILEATYQIAAKLSTPFLLIGQRWDLEVKEAIDFSPGWEIRLKDQVKRHGRLHPPAGSDYFVYPHDVFTEMPDFAIGRAGWDNWMIYHARLQGWPVIDGTPSVRIIHQNHDYHHLPGGLPHYDLDESQHNMDLGGGLKHMYMVLDSNCQLRGGKILRPQFSMLRFIRSIERNLMPKDGRLRGVRGALTRRLRKLRRKLAKEL
jgi:hypothetical protein